MYSFYVYTKQVKKDLLLILNSSAIQNSRAISKGFTNLCYKWGQNSSHEP